MTIKKKEMLQMIRQLPNKVDIEELIYRLYLREKLAGAEKDIASGRTLSIQEMRRQAAQWK